MARPKKNIEERRTLNRIIVNPTLDEKEAIKNKAALLGISVSDLLLRSALDRRIVSFDKETKMFLHELLKIGNNVNQITRQLNAIVRDGRTGELKKFDQQEKCFIELRKLLDELTNRLDNR
ncbi:plasmid mobilization protein [Alistipes sp. ZOR0009]|uniref:plasmid mobilization protein n=1 Tax=Alistipes sp. ZOR0009 TaxID=1339253 RepID=UPI0006472017|nr:plasmid mobilization relaxosome protein MobC [Alistipes sp. ZOR0009]